jgi:membrane glycosyltransferase
MYLRVLGVKESREIACEALHLVEGAFANPENKTEEDLFCEVMERLPKSFSIPTTPKPPSMPSVNRASIGYEPQDESLADKKNETNSEKSHADVSRPAVRMWWRWIALRRRLLLTLIVLVQVVFATRYALWVLPYHGRDALEIAIAGLFAILFTWISIGFWMGVYGFFLRRIGGDKHSLLQRHSRETLQTTKLAKTAILLPIYHEPIDRTLGGLRSVYLSLQKTGLLEHFDFFILSDSRSPDVWLSEQATWYQLVRELHAEEKLFYRRRSLNMHYKSGNVADFLRRWGKNYTYSIVLDADSLMSGDTLVTMVRLMQQEPRVGILQTSPGIVNAKSLFARAQQFANQVYGPLFTTGLAALQLGEAAYWGHNAIFRNDLFMKHCGLRQLSGFGLFGGPILSHDFVEAAYMGRAGYEVWLEPELKHSFEESPPTLEDELTRDKRWAKGNLQHLWLLLFGRRIRLAHRLAFLNGVMSYCASPLWLAFLGLSTLEVARIRLRPINYFPSEYSLFPVWPEWHSQSAILLTGGTACLLFLPKILAIIDVMLTGRRRLFGGGFRLLRSVILEVLISILLAPIRMLAHTRYVLESLFNVTLSWAGQNRTEETGWWPAFVAQAPGMVLALSWAGFAYWLDKMFFIWSLPVALPLIFAAPTSVILSRASLGQRFRRRGVLLVPEEVHAEPLLVELDRLSLTSANRPGSAFVRTVIDPVLNDVQGDLARPRTTGAKQNKLKSLREQCLKEGFENLSKKELSLLAQDRESLRWLHEAAWRQGHDSQWGKELNTIFTR